MSTATPKVPVYDGALKGNFVGGFIKDGYDIQVIRPGLDSQGKRRPAWTQFLIDTIPIFETKLQQPIRDAVATFEAKWDQSLGSLDPEQLAAAVKSALGERRRKFDPDKEPAPGITVDGATTKQGYVT